MKECNQKSVDQIKATIQERYSYLQEGEIDAMFDMAVADYLRLKYPSMNSTVTNDTLVYDFTISQWIIARMIDILDRSGGSNLTAYSENGLKFSYGASFIDPELRKQIMPRVGVPK